MGNFVKIGEDFKAESWNGAMLLTLLMNPIITLKLPADFNTAVYGDEEQKVGPFLINLILVDCELSTDNTQIKLSTGKTTATATLRVYPNFEPFKKWISISNSNNVPFDIKKNFGQTAVATSATNDLTGYALVLEYVDFIFNLSSSYDTLANITLNVQAGF